MSVPNRAAIFLVMLVLAAGAWAKEERVYVGKVTELSRDDLNIDQGFSLLSIGFFGEPGVLDRLKGLKVGDEVRAVFGSGIPPGGKRPINKLLDIRRCVRNDRQCARL